MTRFDRTGLWLWWVFWLASCTAPAAAQVRFEVTFDPAVRSEPFTGRVILFMSDRETGEPRKDEGWLSRQPIFSQAVTAWKPGEALVIDSPQGYPCELRKLPAKDYGMQAVMHVNPDEPHSGTSPGNLYSKTVRKSLDPGTPALVRLRIDQHVSDRAESDLSPGTHRVRLRSRLLSKFHRRDVFLRAIVRLPKQAGKDRSRRFPTLYIIPGFGGDASEALRMAQMLGEPTIPMARVGLDPTCPLGHSVFADSDNNGPWGRALTEELIPHLEATYPLVADARARLLTGHSSGGWASLWLQVTYPDFFGGTWSTSPDSVTFRDFSGVDMYAPEANFFVDSEGNDRPIIRSGEHVLLTVRDFLHREDVIGPGGQLQSFEAVFGPRGKDGKPVPAYDRRTGRVDPEVMRAWRRYDIVEMLEREWKTLGPKLTGKIFVLMGGLDNFYLDGATRELKKSLKHLGSDARVTVVAGKNHGTILFTPEARAIMPDMQSRLESVMSDLETGEKQVGPSSRPAERSGKGVKRRAPAIQS